MASGQHLNDVASAANDLLIKLPKDLSAPHQKYSVAKIKGRRVAAAGFARPRLLSFYAAWAEPCKQLSADLDKVHTEYGEQLEIVKVDVDKNQEAAQSLGIQSIPTLILFKEGKILWKQSGVVQAKQLEQVVKQFA